MVPQDRDTFNQCALVSGRGKVDFLGLGDTLPEICLCLPGPAGKERSSLAL